MFAATENYVREVIHAFNDQGFAALDPKWSGGLPQFLDFCKQLRRRFPAGKLYLICDNYGPHGKAEVTDWCGKHGIELVYTPSNASC